MGLLTNLRAVIDSVWSFTAGGIVDAGGSRGVAFPPLDVRWASGSSNNEANAAAPLYEQTIATGATDTIDLNSIAMIFGTTTAFAEVRAIGIYVHNNAATDALTIGKGATNGWTGLGASWTVTLQRGTHLILACPIDGEYAVSGSNKTIDIANSSGATVTYSVFVIGTLT